MTTEHLTDDEARGMLARAARAVADTLERVEAAIRRVNQEEADALHAARVASDHKRMTVFGVRSEDDLMRVHPLYPLMQLASRLAKSLGRILAITNPNLYVERKVAELRAAREFKQSQAA